jgi:imidazolonepropionase-like amidohydrolase
MRQTRILIGAVLLAALVVPRAVAQEAIAIRGAKINTMTGPPIESGTVVIENGLITAVGADVQIPAGSRVIDGAGLEVYPGMFDAITQLGLTEIGAVDVTSDRMELGTFNPHLFGMTAVHPSSEHIPVARANGITHAVAAPDARSGGIGGQASLLHLDGWTVEEMLIDTSVGFVTSWPSIGGGGRRFGGFGGSSRGGSYRQQLERYNTAVEALDEFIASARRYDRAVKAGAEVPRDLRLEAMGRVVNGDRPLLIHARTVKQMRDAIAFAERNDVRIVLLRATEAYKMADELAAAGVPVIIGPTQSMPQDEINYDQMYGMPGVLHEAGVTFALATFNASNSRTLPYEIGSAVSFGLPREAALRAITINAAEIYGFGDQLGSIEEGKIANLVVTDGDLLEIRTQTKHVIINGREVPLDNKHLELYEKYRARPRP